MIGSCQTVPVNHSDRALMLAGVSHDLRTPLTKLRLALAMLKTADPDLVAGADAVGVVGVRPSGDTCCSEYEGEFDDIDTATKQAETSARFLINERRRLALESLIRDAHGAPVEAIEAAR